MTFGYNDSIYKKVLSQLKDRCGGGIEWTIFDTPRPDDREDAVDIDWMTTQFRSEHATMDDTVVKNDVHSPTGVPQ
jgi:hypothetical protein